MNNLKSNRKITKVEKNLALVCVVLLTGLFTMGIFYLLDGDIQMQRQNQSGRVIANGNFNNETSCLMLDDKNSSDVNKSTR